MATKLLRFENTVQYGDLELPTQVLPTEGCTDTEIVQWMGNLVLLNMEDDYHLSLNKLKDSLGKTDFKFTEDYKMGRSIEGLLRIEDEGDGYLVRAYDDALSGMSVDRNMQDAGRTNPYQRWYKTGSTQLRIEKGSIITNNPVVAVEQTHYSGGGMQYPRDIHVASEFNRRRLQETGYDTIPHQLNIDEAAKILMNLFATKEVTT